MELSAFAFGVYKLAKYLLYPYTWLALLVTIQMAAVCSSGAGRRLGLIRLLSLSTFLIVVVLGHPLVSRALAGSLESRHPAFEAPAGRRFDAIVALGGGALPKGTLRPDDDLTDESRARTICGTRRYAEGLAPRLILSGGDGSVFGTGPRESELMRELALRLGVPPQALLTEARSRTTYENAVETKREIGAAKILLVTSAGHMARAAALFEKQGFVVTAAPCTFTVRHYPALWSDLTPFDFIPTVGALHGTTAAFNEIAGIWVYRAAGQI